MTRHVNGSDKAPARASVGDPARLDRRRFLTSTAAAAAIGPLLDRTAEAQATNTTHKGSMSMRERNLGSLTVSELGAGCMSISANYGSPAPKEQGVKTIRAAF